MEKIKAPVKVADDTFCVTSSKNITDSSINNHWLGCHTSGWSSLFIFPAGLGGSSLPKTEQVLCTNIS